MRNPDKAGPPGRVRKVVELGASLRTVRAQMIPEFLPWSAPVALTLIADWHPSVRTGGSEPGARSIGGVGGCDERAREWHDVPLRVAHLADTAFVHLVDAQNA